MKKIIISLMLATSTCVAMMGSANAALHDSSKHSVQVQNHKDDTSAQKNKSTNQKTVKQQPAAKVVKKADQTNNKKQSVNTKAVTPKKSTAQQQPSKSKNVTSDHKSTDTKYDKNHKS
ncbi:hypothetical protein [Psychrobacter sp. SZ93C1]|uniref:hypothetical protein n=1 Tax=Psychrobacter sp. SZ93C1 TaxID=2792058 RepID=UPI0018CDC781|nr:hypothetical protein [Psychrobacter sp. SZ93C1]MBH0064141.1 hypothetical protein [Psychrobacter sp. SZ93C1]